MSSQYKHLDTITSLFVAVLLISNVASSKILELGWFTFDGGTLLFCGVEIVFTPVTYAVVWKLKREERVDWYDTWCYLGYCLPRTIFVRGRSFFTTLLDGSQDG